MNKTGISNLPNCSLASETLGFLKNRLQKNYSSKTIVKYWIINMLHKFSQYILFQLSGY